MKIDQSMWNMSESKKRKKEKLAVVGPKERMTSYRQVYFTLCKLTTLVDTCTCNRQQILIPLKPANQNRLGV